MQPILPLVAFATLLVPPSVDIIPDGMKGVTCALKVDVAPEVRRVAIVGYKIAEGDTLTAIAKAQLGDAERAADIQALNPGIEPKKLTVGQVIWLPPSATDAADADTFYLFQRGQLRHSAEPFVPGGDLGDHYGGGVVAVPKTHVDEYVALMARTDREAQAALDEASWLGESERMGRIRNVPAASKTARIERVFRVTAIHDGVPQIENVEDRHFDSAGERVDPGAAKKSQLLLLVAIAALGAGGLTWFAMRRRRRPAHPYEHDHTAHAA